MKRFIVLTLMLGLACNAFAQEEKVLEGKISFITSSSVYVRFDATNEIVVGSSLQLSGADCLFVQDKSSTSVVCSILNNCEVNVDDTVTYTIRKSEDTTVDIQPQTEAVVTTAVVAGQDEAEIKPRLYDEDISGRISAASYNTFSNLREDRSRLYTDFSLDALHISGSKFSVVTYFSYRNILTGSGSSYNGRTSILNVYDLNVRFDATNTISITAGRSINPKASSLGPVDGVQAEAYFGKFYVGALGGTRPDIEDFTFDPDLLQYGGYLGVETNEKDFRSQTTLGAIEQTNSGSTDRRYIFFQHSSTIASDFNLFSSMELDIFSDAGNDNRLTNLYISGRYRISRAANIMLSYDSRKRVIYYETFQSEIEQLLNNDLARQGIRARVNIRPAKTVWFGVSYGQRFQSDDQNKSDNIYTYITLTKIPKLGGRFNVSYNRNASNYLTSNIFAGRYSRTFAKNKVNADFYYRLAQYSYDNRQEDFNQHYFGTAWSYRITRTWQLSISGEYAKFEDENNYRFYTRISKRF